MQLQDARYNNPQAARFKKGARIYTGTNLYETRMEELLFMHNLYYLFGD